MAEVAISTGTKLEDQHTANSPLSSTSNNNNSTDIIISYLTSETVHDLL